MSITVTSTPSQILFPSFTIHQGSATFAITTRNVKRLQSQGLRRKFAKIQVDTARPTSVSVDYTYEEPTSTTNIVSTTDTTCGSDKDCPVDDMCSKGRCVSKIEAAPLGSEGNLSGEPTSHLTTAVGVGIGLGVVAFIAILLGFAFWLWRNRTKQAPRESIETPKETAERSMSSHDRAPIDTTRWTVENDQKTLVASMPASPRNPGHEAHNEMHMNFFAKLREANEGLASHASTTYGSTHAMRDSPDNTSDHRSIWVEKALPPPPPEPPLPPPPPEEKSYAINVNINKSAIFEDATYNAASSIHEAGTAREKTPRYRFEEYVPPVTTPPRISITEGPSTSIHSSDYEMDSYTQNYSWFETGSIIEEHSDSESNYDSGKSSTESTRPPLILPELPPPSPSLSFRSYDWYQDIIGDERPTDPPTPTIPPRNPARTPTQTTFSDFNFPVPSASSPNLLLARQTEPALASPALSTFLHPNSAVLPSPTSPEFRLSPTVYKMPSPPPKAAPMRASLQSTMTRKTHQSRSWLPEEGLYLPEDGTMDSYQRFRRPSDSKAPSNYSPLK